MADQKQPVGVHLVGSMAVQSVEEGFSTACAMLPGRLRRVTDGEPGERNNFVRAEMDRVPDAYRWAFGTDGTQGATVPEAQARRDLQSFHTRYDTAAIESYETFKSMKSRGQLPEHVRFQVCVPSSCNLVIAARTFCRPVFDEIVMADLAKAIDNIQRAIPEHELAIQLDCAIDMALIEGDVPHKLLGPMSKPYFEPVLEGLVDRVEALANHVKAGVEFGIHFCYGDFGNEHYMQPADTGNLVKYASAILSRLQRPVQWMHMPVPKDRDDHAYFAPLKNLTSGLGATELFLGLVHDNDEEGTRRRIAAAQKVVTEFGVAAECGYGRSSPERMASSFKIAKEVTKPYT